MQESEFKKKKGEDKKTFFDHVVLLLLRISKIEKKMFCC